jgi:putative endonuclease
VLGARVTRARQELGRAGEQRVAEWYEARGYAVLDRNWRCRLGEIDLVVAQARLLVVCEVKTRSSLDFGHPAEAVGWRKQQRLRQLAAQWITDHRARPASVRFDVAAVLPTSIDVVEAAF